MTLISTRIPFAGFYESIWSYAIDREVERRAENWTDDRDDFNREFPALAHVPDEYLEGAFADAWEAVDYSAAYAALAREYAVEFAAWLGDSLDTELAFEFEEVVSPKFYNFETDRLFIKLPLAAFETIRARLGEDAVADEFKAMFTSRDGFASFYDNTPPSKPLAEWDHNELYALLVAWVEHELPNRSIDDELFDYRSGGLYEEAYRIADDATDWPKLREIVTRTVLDALPEDELTELAAMPVRCPDTLELGL